MSKKGGLTLDSLLSKDELTLRQECPHGARLVMHKGEERWQPADCPEAATKPLSELLKAKEDRLVEAPMMRPGRGETTVAKFSMGRRTKWAGEFGEPEPAKVYSEDQKRIAQDARYNDAVRKAGGRGQDWRDLQAAYKAKREAVERAAREMGLDVRSDLRVVDRRFQEIERKFREAA